MLQSLHYKKITVFVALIFLAISSFAQEQASKTPLEDYQKQLARDTKAAEEFRRYRTETYIGHDLYKGETLIYLCQKQHFACVNSESLLNCERAPEMGCLIISKFKDQKECFTKQLEMMLKSRIDKFCKTN